MNYQDAMLFLQNLPTSEWVDGDKIYVEGRIKSRQWQTEEGSTKFTTEIQVTEFTFLTTKKESEPFKPSNSDSPAGLLDHESPY